MITSSQNILIESNLEKSTSINNDFFFQSNEFVTRNLKSDFLRFTLLSSNKKIAQITFYINKDHAISLNRSPFGGLIFVGKVKNEKIGNFISEVNEHLIKLKIKKISVICHPECYNKKDFDVNKKAFLSNHFKCETLNLAQYIDVTKTPFESIIAASERRYINSANRMGYSFKSLNLSQLPKAYSLIKASRDIKGYPTTLTLEELTRNVKLFDANYKLFGLFNAETMIATSVCVVVNDNILYDFYHGDDLTYRKNSPVVPLIQNIYKYCQNQGFQILDLGVSTESGDINKGLFDFKKNLGSKTTLKPTYTLCL